MTIRELVFFIIGFLVATIMLHLLFSYGMAHILDHISIGNVEVLVNETKMVDYILKVSQY